MGRYRMSDSFGGWWKPLPSFIAFIDQFVDIFEAGDGQFGEVFDIGTEQRVLTYPQIVLVLRIQQIADALAVNLHVAHLRHHQRQIINVNICVYVILFLVDV